MWESLFPPGIAVVPASADAWDAPLEPEEAASLGPASPARRREFAAGRACARQALARLGLPVTALPRAPDRAPLWPAGAVGSISHCAGHCAAAAAPARHFLALGLDLERTGRVHPGLVRRICTPAEGEALGAWSAAGLDPLTLVFSAKEAVYKAWQPLTGARLGFQDVEIELEPLAGRFAARVARGEARLEGRFAIACGLVATGIALESA